MSKGLGKGHLIEMKNSHVGKHIQEDAFSQCLGDGETSDRCKVCCLVQSCSVLRESINIFETILLFELDASVSPTLGSRANYFQKGKG